MGYPINPGTIILKNKFYSRGLTEINVWNYYQSVKRSILEETKSRDIMLVIMADLNKPIIRRRGKQNKVIRLTPANYDDIITGRTLSIHSAMGPYETFSIIDIDIHPSDGFSWAKEVTSQVYNYVMDKMPLVRSATIRYTGKQSFHIKCEFGRKMKMDSIRFLMKKFLMESELSRVYTVGGKRRAGVPNLDLSPNKYRGNYITLNALSMWGLKSMEVPYNSLRSFNINKAVI